MSVSKITTQSGSLNNSSSHEEEATDEMLLSMLTNELAEVQQQTTSNPVNKTHEYPNNLFEENHRNGFLNGPVDGALMHGVSTLGYLQMRNSHYMAVKKSRV